MRRLAELEAAIDSISGENDAVQQAEALLSISEEKHEMDKRQFRQD